MAAARFMSAGTPLYLYARLSGCPSPTLREWKSAAIAGTLMLGAANGLVTWSEVYVPSGLAALLVATVPFCMTLLDWVAFGGRRPRGLTVLGLFTGFIGVALLMAPGPEVRYVHPAGGLGLLTAAVCWSTGTLYARKAELPSSPLITSAMEMLAGGAVLTVIGTLSGEWLRFVPAAVTMKSILALAYLAVFGSLVGFGAFVWLLKRTSPALISTYAFVNPLVAVFLGWLVLSEPVHNRMLAATGLIVGAVVLIQFAGARASAQAAAARVLERK
jgi:drug/metabolite transporter (DMT)-like permease